MDGRSRDVGPIGAVRDGMRVVDASGDEVGTVAEVRMSDPGAVTTRGQDTPDEPLLAGLGSALVGGDGLSEHDRERLVRLGYVRIDAHGLFAKDRYAAADEIADVAGDEVRLGVPGSRLVS